MDTNYPTQKTHPEGELSKNNSEDHFSSSTQPLTCDTYGGLVHVEWDEQAPITPIGQLVFFVQFLKSCNLFGQWVEDCPLLFSSPNAPKKVDILGTMLLSVLSGQTRYAHITGIRQDAVNPSLLGMSRVLSEDSVRRAFQNANADKCKKWQQKHLEACFDPLLAEKWILDVDATIKILYGNQEGAEVGYNPTKPGRPAHIIHTYVMAETRLILDCEVQSGKQSAASYSLPGLLEIIDRQPEGKKPSLVRGDCAFGNERVLKDIEYRFIDYLFKVRQTKKVKELIDLCNRTKEDWTDAGQGWEGVGAELLLTGWSKKRRVIVLRRKMNKTRGRKKKNPQQLLLPFMGAVLDSSEYEYAVLVTTLNGEILTIAQLYRDRATSENNFDELKNQWGWAGFVTQDLKRSQIMARIVAQVYNWWTLFVRWVEPDKHREAITSRPLMLYGVARQTQHAGQTTLKVTPMHGKAAEVQKRVGLITRFLNVIKSYAEQYNIYEKWRRILSVIFVNFLKGRLLGDEQKEYEKWSSNRIGFENGLDPNPA